jgi:plasmid maintenance system killer protein
MGVLVGQADQIGAGEVLVKLVKPAACLAAVCEQRNLRARVQYAFHATQNMAGAWAMNINGPWRLVFRFKDGDVEIVDYDLPPLPNTCCPSDLLSP